MERIEAAAIETDFRGLHFERNVHLAGDAAGLASGLSLVKDAAIRTSEEPQGRG